MDKIRNEVKTNHMAAAGYLITRLNPMIKGWAYYHQHICNKDTFHYGGYATFKRLWRWVKRRHSSKGARWLKKKYFETIGKRDWIFTGERGRTEGKSRKVHLWIAAYTKINKYTKVRSEANPYNPNWEPYIEHRLGVKIVGNQRGRAKLLNLGKSHRSLYRL